MKKRILLIGWGLAALSFLLIPLAHAQLKPINNLVVQNAGSPLTGLLYGNGGSTAATALTPSAVLDLIGNTQGNILYRNASGWVILAPGTAGWVLQTGGTGANPSWVAQSGGGGTPGGSNTQVQFNDSGAFGGNANWTYNKTTGVQTQAVNSIGTTGTDGYLLQNTTAAAAGAQQYSPRIHLIGRGWATSSSGSSHTVEALMEVRPTQGTILPSFSLVFYWMLDGSSPTTFASSDGSNWIAQGMQASSTNDATGVTNAPLFSAGGAAVTKTLFIGTTIRIVSGANKKSGTFTLASGTVTVSNTAVTANSVIHITVKTVSGTRTGNPDIVPTAGTGFVATEIGGTSDNSTYNYWIEDNN